MQNAHLKTHHVVAKRDMADYKKGEKQLVLIQKTANGTYRIFPAFRTDPPKRGIPYKDMSSLLRDFEVPSINQYKND